MEELFQLRMRLKEVYETEIFQNRGVKEHAETELVFVVDSPDAEIASLLELLEGDIEDFFFGVRVKVESMS